MHRLPFSSEPAPLGRAMIILGWREPVALPDWGIASITAKLDTGARTSAIHVDNIHLLRNDRVAFDVIVSVGKDRQHRQCVPVTTHIVRVSRVRPSHGKQQERYVVSTRMRLGPIEREIELSLVSRKGMMCRMLLGRTAMKHSFLIDPAHPTLLGNAHSYERKSST